MSDDMWMVTAVTHHDCGDVTLTMRNQTTGVVKTEDYPAGSMVLRIIPDGPPVNRVAGQQKEDRA